jgi:retron-type reverse transcriptase
VSGAGRESCKSSERVKAAAHGFFDFIMKIKNVFDEIISMENLYAALQDASRGRRYKWDVLIFNFDAWTNLKDLRDEIYAGKYRIDKYHLFYVNEPKKRLIMSISFRHRVVQWAIYRVLNPIFTKSYIEDSYGCINGRGALSAMKRLKYWVDQIGRKPGNWYFLKIDISKYFYRVSHRALKRILAKKIKDKRLLDLLYGIIDYDGQGFGLPLGAKPGETAPEDMLFDVGMPIGNLMSQTFANLYLDTLDQFCKRTLRIHYYIRYMDDVIILSDDKEQLKRWKGVIEEFVEKELELALNKKTCIRPVSQGIEFVGYRIWSTHVTIRKSSSLRIRRSLRGIARKYHDYEMTFEDADKRFQCYMGMLQHFDSHNLKTAILDEFVLTHGDRISPEEEI